MTMKCPKAHELIGELLEESISDKDRKDLEKHLESCQDCRELLTDFQNIKTQAASLPKLEPSEAVWTNILDGVRRDRRAKAVRSATTAGWWDRLFLPGRPRYAFGAALAMIAVIVGAIAIWKPWRSAQVVPPADGTAFTMAKLEEAETHYQLAIQALTAAVDNQKNGLDPRTVASLDRNLQVIDDLILACKNAVRQEPQSVEARVYLLGAYKGKVEFLDNLIVAKKKSAAPSAPETIL
jgi:anti-sigma factor RsiW